MNKDKSFLRHEILNIITLVNFLVIDSKMDKRTKEEVLEHLKMAALLIAEENLFLGKKKAFFNQPIDLNETLQIVKALVQKEAQKKGVRLSIPSTNLVVYADAGALKNGLEQLLRYLIEHSTMIAIHLNEGEKSITIEHEAPAEIFNENMSLIELLKSKSSPHLEIFCCTALEIMKMNGMHLSFEPGRIKVQLSKK